MKSMRRTAAEDSSERRQPFLQVVRSGGSRRANPGENMGQAERWAREREFHNQRFQDDTTREERVGRFYAAIGYGFELYRRRVEQASRRRRLLEYGCGNASLAFDIAPSAEQVIGIDISEVAIRQAQRIAAARGIDNAKFMVDNAECMHIPDASIDVLAGSAIVHHLDIPRAMSEVRRVLRPGGVAIFIEPLGHNPLVNWYRKRTPELRTEDEQPLLTKDLREMQRLFARGKVTYFGLVAPVLGLFSAQVDANSRLTKLIWALDRLVCRLPLLRRYAWYCLIELQA